jgi:putative transposase
MPRKVFTPEQIVTALRQIEVAIAQGKSTPMACREAGISDVSYYRWRKEYGGLQLDQAKRMSACIQCLNVLYGLKIIRA